MAKKIVTYIMTLFLLVTIVTPTVFLLVDNNCDIEQYETVEEENSDKKSTKDFEEIKIYQLTDITTFYNFLALKKHFVFYTKNYTSDYQKLDTPPPELFF